MSTGLLTKSKAPAFSASTARSMLPKAFDAVAIRQAHVGDAQVIRIAGQQFTCFGQVGGGTDAQPHAAEGQYQQFADVAFVVDDEGAAGFVHGRER
ncbi:hypothetical protein G6F35_015358 [Rhizopus arrhizus]|nr:hypothetical protein G6F21_014259 [Rhizopus arrhizus]KAG1183389.1 hypothetical protein G6F35_015358 [Rhizopus arrhizus]